MEPVNSSRGVSTGQLWARPLRGSCSCPPHFLGFAGLKAALRAPFAFPFVVASLVFLGCNVSSQEIAITPVPRTAEQECRGLEDRLRRMMSAQDSTRFALEQRIYYQGGLVRVSIELASAEAQLPSGYGLQVEGRAQNLIQALLPLQELCQLSNEPQVLSVMVPSEIRLLGR